MKKLFLMLALFSATVLNAQIATENSKTFDNVGIGITGGVSTPLDFNSVFPVNPNVGLKITKDITPVLGFQIEGLAILNDNHFTDLKTAVKATNVGLNGAINLSNLIGGYKGTPRVFEISAIGGLGWLHTWDTSVNNFTSKTGFDFALNLGKAHSLVLTPAVYWNLNKLNAIKFDKRNSQLAVNLSYIYHFKTSNGTRHFKTYDIGAMIDEIDRLNQELAKKPTVVTEYVDKINTVEIIKYDDIIVFFAFDSAELTETAKQKLDEIAPNTEVIVLGYASPEGTLEHNLKLSQDRANSVKDYLEGNRVIVKSAQGMGVQGESTNRVVLIKSLKY